jgi:hypothetical protein
MIVFPIIVCILVGILLILMHLSYRSEIKFRKECFEQALLEEREESFHRGWNEGVTNERVMWQRKVKADAATELLPVIK